MKSMSNVKLFLKNQVLSYITAYSNLLFPLIKRNLRRHINLDFKASFDRCRRNVYLKKRTK